MLGGRASFIPVQITDFFSFYDRGAVYHFIFRRVLYYLYASINHSVTHISVYMRKQFNIYSGILDVIPPTKKIKVLRHSFYSIYAVIINYHNYLFFW